MLQVQLTLASGRDPYRLHPTPLVTAGQPRRELIASSTATGLGVGLALLYFFSYPVILLGAKKVNLIRPDDNAAAKLLVVTILFVLTFTAGPFYLIFKLVTNGGRLVGKTVAEARYEQAGRKARMQLQVESCTIRKPMEVRVQG